MDVEKHWRPSHTQLFASQFPRHYPGRLWRMWYDEERLQYVSTQYSFGSQGSCLISVANVPNTHVIIVSNCFHIVKRLLLRVIMVWVIDVIHCVLDHQYRTLKCFISIVYSGLNSGVILFSNTRSNLYILAHYYHFILYY